MASSASEILIRQWRERFRADPLGSKVVSSLRGRGNEIWRNTFELLRKESPEYRNAVDDEFTRESRTHCGELLNSIVAVADGQTINGEDSFDFVRTHAVWRAQHQVPLIASLHAYRLAHKTYWGLTREALLSHAKRKETLHSLALLSDFWIEFFDHVGATLAEAHAVEEGLVVAQRTRTYVGLIDDLLRGIPPRDEEAQRLSVLCGIQPGAPMTVVVVRPLRATAGSQVDLDVTLRSVVRLLEQALPAATFGKLVDIRNNEVVAIVRGSVLDALRSRFANGLVAAVGVSRDVCAISELPRALEEASVAFEFATASRPLRHFSEIDLPEFLIRRADDLAFRLIPDWASNLDENDQDGELSRTIRAFADCNFNVKQTANRMRVHMNTVYFRLNRIKKITGIDPRTYAGTSLLLTVLRLQQIGSAMT